MGISLSAREMQAIVSACEAVALLQCDDACAAVPDRQTPAGVHPATTAGQRQKSPLPPSRRDHQSIQPNFHHFIRRLMSCSCADLRVAARDTFQGCKAQERSGMQRLPRHCHVLRAVRDNRAKSTCLPTFQHFTLTTLHVISYLSILIYRIHYDSFVANLSSSHFQHISVVCIIFIVAARPLNLPSYRIAYSRYRHSMA
jgi:hypothetical protein